VTVQYSTYSTYMYNVYPLSLPLVSIIGLALALGHTLAGGCLANMACWLGSCPRSLGNCLLSPLPNHHGHEYLCVTIHVKAGY
jgi:hypothetical protein